jgi:UDP-N-acetylmuramoyl-tripeptide--D-alanyl-D-alanine ligase
MDTLLQLFLNHGSVSTDTRKIKEGDLFFALKGANFNGNVFASRALEAGAAAVIIDEAQYASEDERIILVPNVLNALQQLASAYRMHLAAPVVALTGSNGKTTTKELIAAVLSTKYKLHFTRGNLNNEIGVPLTILSAPPDTEMMVIEMGANHQGEIMALCEIARPDYGMITNIGLAHLEGFGGPEGVKKGKSEMYKYLETNGGKIFLNTADDILFSLVKNPTAAILYNANDYQTEPGEFLHLKDNAGHVYISHLVGAYNKANMVAAISIGRYFGVDIQQIQNAISNYLPSNNRSQKAEYRGAFIIKDAYNANPSSMNAALDAFLSDDTPNKIVILGDMLELGDFSRDAHISILQKVCAHPLRAAIFIGPRFYELKDLFPAQFFLSADDARPAINWSDYAGKTVLLKGSRGIALEKLLETNP